MEPATAGDSIFQATLSPVITGLNHDLRLPWGSRPRLYAYACFAGWAIVQNFGMRSLLARITFVQSRLPQIRNFPLRLRIILC